MTNFASTKLCFSAFRKSLDTLIKRADKLPCREEWVEEYVCVWGAGDVRGIGRMATGDNKELKTESLIPYLRFSLRKSVLTETVS